MTYAVVAFFPRNQKKLEKKRVVVNSFRQTEKPTKGTDKKMPACVCATATGGARLAASLRGRAEIDKGTEKLHRSGAETKKTG